MMFEVVFSYAGSDHFAERTARHSHRGYELLFVESGSCRIGFSDGGMLSGGPGDLFFIPPRVKHDRSNFTECETYYAVFELEPGAPELPRKSHIGDDRLLREWLHELPELNGDYAQEQASSLIRTILLRILWLEDRRECSRNQHPAVRKACDFMNRNFARKLTVAEIAGKASVSASHLDMLFRTGLGTSPQQYLAALRMSMARRLLLNPTLNVSEVAARTGFEDLHYFTRFFRRFHGVPPSIYRRDPARFADNMR